MDHSNEILGLSKEMYDGYGFSEAIGIEYFTKFSDRAKNLSITELIAFQIKRYSSDYVFDFLLSTPYLWSELSGLEWLKIISLVNPRPDPLPMHDHHSHFADIHFLCKYLQVDALNLFLENEDFSKTDKRNVLRYFKREAVFLFMDELDIEDMDGEYFMNFSQLQNVKSNLLKEGTFKEFNYKEDSLVIHAKDLLIKFDEDYQRIYS
jgi:hypothetical protein